MTAGNPEAPLTAAHIPNIPAPSGNGHIPTSHPVRVGMGRKGGSGDPSSEPKRLLGLFQRAADFIESAGRDPEADWLVKDMVPAYGGVLIAAPPSTGKTFAALAAAREALLRGRAVFVVEEEGSRRGLADRLTGMGLPLDRLHIAHRRGVMLGDAESFGALLGAIKLFPGSVLILDPLAALMTGDENSTQDASAFTRKLKELLDSDPGLLILLLHHTNKASGGGAALNSARGNIAFVAWSDTFLVLESERAEPGSGQVACIVEVVRHREAEGNGLRRRLVINLGSGEVEFAAVAQDGPERLGPAILGTLAKSRKRLLAEDIRKQVGARNADVLTALKELVAAKQITRDLDGYQIARAAR